MNIATLPPTSWDNPYYRLFYGALESHGLKQMPGTRYAFDWFRQERHRVDAVHFHWLHPYYTDPSLGLTVRNAVRLRHFVIGLREQHIPIIWTCHNLLPHESRSRAVDVAVRLCMARHAQVVVVLSHAGARRVRRAFRPRGQILVVPHGHLIGVYPDGGDRTRARQHLEIPERAFTYLFFGQVRPYKGVEELITSFRAVPDPDAHLLVAGWPLSVDYALHLRRIAAPDGRIRLVLDRVPDEELALYFAAADLTTLPFRRTPLSSGSIMLSLSLGIPVVIPQEPSLLEYVNGRTAYAFPRGQGLTDALSAARTARDAGALASGPEVIEWARRFDWASAVAPLARLLTAECGTPALAGANERSGGLG
jgi:beta-1,4-mannosyltransferase